MAHKAFVLEDRPAHEMLAAVLDPGFLNQKPGQRHRFEFACDLIVNPQTKAGLIIPAWHHSILNRLENLCDKLARRNGGIPSELQTKYNRVIDHINDQQAKHPPKPATASAESAPTGNAAPSEDSDAHLQESGAALIPGPASDKDLTRAP